MYWTTKSGKDIHLTDMTDSHLFNTWVMVWDNIYPNKPFRPLSWHRELFMSPNELASWLGWIEDEVNRRSLCNKIMMKRLVDNFIEHKFQVEILDNV